MPDVPSAAPAGWFPDGSGQLRYWDGSAWTQHVAPMVQPAAPQVQAPSAAALAAVAAAQQAEQAKAARAADAARIQAERAAVAEQQRAAKAAQREAAMQAKAAEREAAARTKAERASATVAIPAPAPAWPAPTAQVAPTASTALLSDTRPGIHPAATWIVASVAAVIILISAAGGGFRGMFVSLGFVALAAALYTVVFGRRGFVPALTSRPRGTVTAVGAVLMLIVGAALPASASGSAPTPAVAAVATATSSPTPTPSATPTPVVHVVEDVSAKSATDARALLREAGYVVQYVLESGGVPSVTDGMTVKSQSPVAGSRVDAGSTVTLVLLAPAPTPTPEPTVAPAPAATSAPAAPAPKPAAPAPAPVAPAPAPAAPAPAPAPAPGRVITPGAFCKKTEVGSVEKSETGKSYRCAPDADGQRNRWYPI